MSKVRKGSPLLILCLIGTAVALGAYVFWWQSGVVEHQIRVRGMNAFLMPSNPTDYYAKTPATVLTDATIKNEFEYVTLENCVILAIDDALFDGDIHLKSLVSSTYPGTVSAKMWFCTVGFLEETPKDVIYAIDYMTPINLPIDGLIPVVLTQAEALDIFWTDNSETGVKLPTGFSAPDFINGVLIQYDFTGVTKPFGIYDFDITVSLYGDDGS